MEIIQRLIFGEDVLELDYAAMPLSEKRSHYKCGTNFIPLGSLIKWPDLSSSQKEEIKCLITKNQNVDVNVQVNNNINADEDINAKVTLFQGSITRLEIDAIVNPTQPSLLGETSGAGTCHRAIYEAGGRQLEKACSNLQGCKIGNAVLTSGYALPAKYVIHSPGPNSSDANKETKLKNCYGSILDNVKIKNEIRSVAIPCISTGNHEFDNRKAAHIALRTTREWLTENHEYVDRIIFCTYGFHDYQIYMELMEKIYFRSGVDVSTAPMMTRRQPSETTDLPL